MYTWKELADKFEDLQGPLRHASLSVHWGYEGTSMNLQGSYRFPQKHRFQTLSEIAGKKLEALHRDRVKLKQKIYTGNDHKLKWYEALWNLGSSAEHNHIAHSVKDDEIVGNIYSGTIRNPVEDSVNLCLRFSEFDKEEIGWVKWLWKEYGKEIFISLVVGVILIVLGILIESWLGLTDLFKK